MSKVRPEIQTFLETVDEIYNQGDYARGIELISKQLEDPEKNQYEVVSLYAKLGFGHFRLSEDDKALDTFNMCLILSRAIHDRSIEASALHYLGTIYTGIDTQKSTEYLEKALEIRRELQDKMGESSTLNNLGNVYLNVGMYSEALRNYQESIMLKAEIGAHYPGLASSTINLGEIYARQGFIDRSIRLNKRALRYAELNKSLYPLVGAKLNLVLQYIMNGDFTLAFTTLGEVRLKVEELGWQNEQAWLTYYYYSLLYAETNQPLRAREWFEKVKTMTETKDPSRKKRLAVLDATLCSRASQWKQAEKAWEHVKQTADEDNDFLTQIDARLELAAVKLNQENQSETAIQLTCDALNLAERYEILPRAANTLIQLLHKDRERLRLQYEFLERSLNLVQSPLEGKVDVNEVRAYLEELSVLLPST